VSISSAIAIDPESRTPSVVPSGKRVRTAVTRHGKQRTAVARPSKPANRDAAKSIVDPRWTPWIFATKTTISALLALLIAFTFDLDQPKWAALTVFIVAQPQSGLVLAKSFYRIIGQSLAPPWRCSEARRDDPSILQDASLRVGAHVVRQRHFGSPFGSLNKPKGEVKSASY